LNDKRKVILFDTEEEYVTRLWDFLSKQRGVMWDLIMYTRLEMLLQEAGNPISILVASERSYSTDLGRLKAERILILNESGRLRLANYRNVSKYQAADDLFRLILEEYAQISSEDTSLLRCGTKCFFIGIFSPVHRCLQTNFALTMGQIIAKKHRVLYLNFEHYGGDGELTQTSHKRDLADLLYFLDASADEFGLRLQIMRERKGRLDYIPPVKNPEDLLHIRAKEWIRFLEKLEATGEYDYIIMDLSDSLQGLYEILRICRRVFTITKEDRFAKGKLLQYEHLLEQEEYQDVIEKTSKCALPMITGLPEGIENYTRGDLAEYVEKQLQITNILGEEDFGKHGISGIQSTLS